MVSIYHVKFCIPQKKARYLTTKKTKKRFMLTLLDKPSLNFTLTPMVGSVKSEFGIVGIRNLSLR
jgi:hypothetical protein